MSIPPSTGLLHALGGLAQAKPAAAARPAPWLGPASPGASPSARPAAHTAAEPARREAAQRPQDAVPLGRSPDAPRPNLPRGSLFDVKV